MIILFFFYKKIMLLKAKRPIWSEESNLAKKKKKKKKKKKNTGKMCLVNIEKRKHGWLVLYEIFGNLKVFISKISFSVRTTSK